MHLSDKDSDKDSKDRGTGYPVAIIRISNSASTFKQVKEKQQ